MPFAWVSLPAASTFTSIRSSKSHARRQRNRPCEGVGIVRVDRVVALDPRAALKGGHGDEVVAGPRADPRRARGRARDLEGVVAPAEQDVQRLDAGVDDPAAEPEPGDRGRRQRARPAGGVAAVVDAQPVDAVLVEAFDRQRRCDSREHAFEVAAADPGAAADLDQVVADAGRDLLRSGEQRRREPVACDPRRPGDAANVDLVVASAAFDRRRACVRALDREGVAA